MYIAHPERSYGIGCKGGETQGKASKNFLHIGYGSIGLGIYDFILYVAKVTILIFILLFVPIIFRSIARAFSFTGFKGGVKGVIRSYLPSE